MEKLKQLIKSYKTDLETLKGFRKEQCDIMTDVQNEHLDELIKKNAKILRELKEIENEIKVEMFDEQEYSMNPREKYYNWILNNPKWLKMPKTAYIRLKDDIVNDISICNDLIKLYPEISKEEPEELLQINPLRFFLFVRAFMVDVRWKIKYERHSIINNNKENELS